MKRKTQSYEIDLSKYFSVKQSMDEIRKSIEKNISHALSLFKFAFAMTNYE